MDDTHRPLHKVLVGQLAHLAELYQLAVGTDQLKAFGISGEMSACCAVLDNGFVPPPLLAEVCAELRAVYDQYLAVEPLRSTAPAKRLATTIANFGSRGEKVDGFRPLHEVLLTWIGAQIETFRVAVVLNQEDKAFLVGREISACCAALLMGVVPAGEIRGAADWLTRFRDTLPRAEGNPSVAAVTAALEAAISDLEGRRLPSPLPGIRRQVPPPGSTTNH